MSARVMANLTVRLEDPYLAARLLAGEATIEDAAIIALAITQGRVGIQVIDAEGATHGGRRSRFGLTERQVSAGLKVLNLTKGLES